MSSVRITPAMHGADSHTVLAGKTITLDVKPTDTIQDIMDKIRAKEGLDFTRHRLRFVCSLMDPTRSLSDYHVSKGSNLYLSFSLRGGAPGSHAGPSNAGASTSRRRSSDDEDEPGARAMRRKVNYVAVDEARDRLTNDGHGRMGRKGRGNESETSEDEESAAETGKEGKGKGREEKKGKGKMRRKQKRERNAREAREAEEMEIDEVAKPAPRYVQHSLDLVLTPLSASLYLAGLKRFETTNWRKRKNSRTPGSSVTATRL